MLRIDKCLILHWEFGDCNYLLEVTVGQLPSDDLLTLIFSLNI